MAKGRHTRPVTIDNRRCSKCKKVAKDLINGEYLCRLHSPIREGFTREKKKEKEIRKEKKGWLRK